MLNKPKKRKKKSNRLPPKQYDNLKREVYERDDYTCIFWNRFSHDHTSLDKPHHIIYKSQGGKDEINNLVTLCIYCHAEVHRNKKKYKPILEEYVRRKNGV